MNIGFWNINKSSDSNMIVQFIIENELDVCSIAEIGPNNLLLLEITKKYKKLTKSNLNCINSCKDKVHVLSRYDQDCFKDISSLYNSERFVSFKFEIKGKIRLNLIFIHFHSKNNWSDISLAMECVTIATAVRDIEDHTQSQNTILMGDFNMNPFESGLMSTNGLNTISDRNFLKEKNGRIVDKSKYLFFYNPMWNFFGDSKEVRGTYYYNTPGNIRYGHNIFDQVLLRPNLLMHLAQDSVKIISRINNESLIDHRFIPLQDKSDHLPITLNLKI